MPRQINLGSLVTGMTRLREKGSPSPKALYDLVNAYVDQSGAPVSRPGTDLDHTLPAGTKGGMAFKEKIHVFATAVIDPGNPKYVVDVLVHPDPNFTGTLVYIHFARPFLGFPYVVAEFSNGDVIHFWLQIPATWKPNTVYGINATVAPSVPNGLYYAAETPVNAPVWQPNTVYPVGSVVQPSTPNGYLYKIISTAGSAAASGSTEPNWPTQAGALVFEETDTSTVPSTGQTQTTSSSSVIPADVAARYGNSTQVNNV